jgi:hypothetical protein
MPKSKKKIQQEYSESDNAFTESDELAKESAKDSVFYKSVDNGSHKINNEDEQIQEDARANFVETTFFERVVKYVKTDNLMRKEAKEHKEKMDTMKTNKQELEDFLVDYLESKKENTININGSGKLTKYKSIRKGGLNKDIIQKSMYDKLKAENIIDDDDKIKKLVEATYEIMDNRREIKEKTVLKRTFTKNQDSKNKSDKQTSKNKESVPKKKSSKSKK